MTLDIVTVPCRKDNYAYLLRDTESGMVGLVDAPEEEPIRDALAARDWRLDRIFLTHHHDDHVAAVEPLRTMHGAKVIGNKADAARLPDLDIAVGEKDTVSLGASTAQVIDVPGHTIGHIAFYFPQAGALFSADSLMALGCGRLFEGSPAQMWESLGKMTALPPETKVYSGHEYAENNARFALSVDPGNADLQAQAEEIARRRAAGEATVPATLASELATNPFLRPHDVAIREGLGLGGASDLDVFAELRRRKDRF